MSFNSQSVRQGNIAKKQAEETPSTFTSGGSSFSAPGNDLAKRSETRMAGPGGAFAMQMMQDPELAQRVQTWGQQFMQSNQGMEFNQAKMMLMGGGKSEGEENPNGGEG